MKKYKHAPTPKFSMPAVIQLPIDLTEEQAKACQNAITEIVKSAVIEYTAQWIEYLKTECQNHVIHLSQIADSDCKACRMAMQNKFGIEYVARQQESERAIGNLNNLVWMATLKELGLSAKVVTRYLHKREEVMTDLYEYGALALYHLTFDNWEGMVYDYSPEMLKGMQEFKNFRALDMEARNYYDAKKRGDADGD